jgi:hypothetical protein
MPTPITNTDNEISAALGSLLHELSAGINAGNDARLERLAPNDLIAAAARAISEGNPEGFRFALPYHAANVVAALLIRAFPNSRETRFLFKEYNFVRLHFRNLFQKHEGACCCNDKAVMVLRKLLNFLLNGKRIEFEGKSEYTYAFPSVIFTTHEEIIEFFNALQDIKYGHGHAYVRQILALERHADEAH